MEVIAAAADSAQRCIAGGGTGQGHRLLRLGHGGRGVAHRHAPVVFRLRTGHFPAFARTPVRFPPAPAVAVSKAAAAAPPRARAAGVWPERAGVALGTFPPARPHQTHPPTAAGAASPPYTTPRIS